MHDEEVRIVDVELDGLEQVLNRLLLGAVAVDEVFARPAQDDLSSDRDLGIVFETDGTCLFVVVVEHDGHAGFCDACLAALVD